VFHPRDYTADIDRGKTEETLKNPKKSHTPIYINEGPPEGVGGVGFSAATVAKLKHSF